MGPRLFASLLSLVLVACGDDTAIDLRLVPDPNLTNTDDLVKRLQTLTVTIDAPDGLGYPSSMQHDQGEPRIVDTDGDGKLEIVATVDVKQLGRLPHLRIERGGLPAGLPIDLRIEGLEGSATIAMGAVPGVGFAEGQAKPMEFPFNLLPRYRAPQVTQVFPSDGATNLPASKLGSVVVVFSKPMNTEALTQPGVFSVLRVEGSNESVVPAGQISVSSLGVGDDAPSTAEYRFASALDKGAAYRVRITTGAVDTAGRKLDQVPMQPGEQPFSSQFSLTLQEAQATTMCTPCTEGCPICEERWCANGGTDCGAEALICNSTTRKCEPKVQSCTPAQCLGQTVCDAALGICVLDCRLYGLGSSKACVGSSGVCLETGVCGSK
jgi:hypothetical protein